MLVFWLLLLQLRNASASEISFTVDDPEVTSSPLKTPKERNALILKAFEENKIKGALFVCGMRIDNKMGVELVNSWNQKGHLIGNHSYSHLYYHSDKVSFEKFKEDFIKNEPLISGLSHFRKFFRFPYLKEGPTITKRDQMREFLQKRGYLQGSVTIDASDWYIDERLREKLATNPHLNLEPYLKFYLKHIWSRAQFYDSLAKSVLGRPVKHTLLLHHNLLNALFLNDVMKMFKSKSWILISAEDAFKDSVFQVHPNVIPAGESLIWSLAKETSRFEDQLRYPGEDGTYEKEEMDSLGL